MTSSPPNFSASVTTPSAQRLPRLQPATGRRPSRAPRSSQTISDEPPPMSNSRIDWASRSASSLQPAAARRASVSRSTISSLRSEPFAHPLEELDAVLRRAAGLGGDQPRPRDAARRHLVAADPQRVERALDRRFAEPAGLGQALAEAHDAREGVDDAKAVRRSDAPPAGGSCSCPDPARRRGREARRDPRRRPKPDAPLPARAESGLNCD